jgi:hypothetical protein
MSPVKYELGFYIPEDGILYSHRRENLKSYITYSCLKQRGRNMVLYSDFGWKSCRLQAKDGCFQNSILRTGGKFMGDAGSGRVNLSSHATV